MIDIWHFYNTRSTIDDLAGFDPDRIAGVQLDDGRVVWTGTSWSRHVAAGFSPATASSTSPA